MKATTLAQAVEQRIEVDPKSGCWNWTRALCGYRCAEGGGYGVFSFMGTRYLAHRAAYLAFNGPITNGLQVRHKCDNSRCCNPEHLELGTQQENVNDCVTRDRHAAGERHALARLTAGDAQRIRVDSRHVDDIAAAYGISRSHVYNIRNHSSWRTAP